MSRILSQYSNNTPIRLSDQAMTFIQQSNDYLNHVLRRYADFANAYKETLQVMNILVDLQNVDHDFSILEWGLEIIGAVIATITPFAGSLFFAMACGISSLQNTFDTQILDIEALRLWNLFGQALGSNVSGPQYNAEIFDRNILASFWTIDFDAQGEPVFGSSTRYSRRLDEDMNGWRILTIACKYWFQQSNGMADLEDRLREDMGYFKALAEVPANLQTVEGFILGWSLLCFIADLDSGIDWGKYLS